MTTPNYPPPANKPNVDYRRSVLFFLDDPDWVGKAIVGVLIGLVPILNLCQQGYGLDLLRRVALGERPELPAWNRWGVYFRKGFGITVAILLYITPGILLGTLLVIFADLPSLIVLGVLVLVVYPFLVLLLLPGAVTRYALTGRWSGMFDLPWIFRFIAARLAAYLLVLAFAAGFGIATAFAGALILGVGAVIAGFYSQVVAYHLFGQLAAAAGSGGRDETGSLPVDTAGQRPDGYTRSS